MAGFTTGSGNDPNAQAQSQLTAQATRTQLNQQKQRRYGAQNGMAAAASAAPPAPAAGSQSPVTPTGQINTAAQAPPPPPPVAPLPAPPTPAAPAQPQWQGGNVGQQALDWAISNPALGPGVVAQQKGQLQDQAGQMLRGSQSDVAANAAARGLSGGGWQGQQEAQGRDSMASGLLGGYREVDTVAADTNRKNLMSALGIDSQNFGTRANILGTMMNRENSKDSTGLGYAQLSAAQQQALWKALMGSV